MDRLRTTATAEPDVAAELGHLESWLGFTHPRLLRRGPRAVRSPVADAPATGSDPWLASAASLSELLLRGQAAAHVGPKPGKVRSKADVKKPAPKRTRS